MAPNEVKLAISPIKKIEGYWQAVGNQEIGLINGVSTQVCTEENRNYRDTPRSKVR